MSRTGCHDACRPLVRVAVMCGVLKREDYVEVITQREYKCLCVIQGCYMGDSDSRKLYMLNRSLGGTEGTTGR